MRLRKKLLAGMISSVIMISMLGTPIIQNSPCIKQSTVFAETTEDGFRYELHNDFAEIIAYQGEHVSDLVIPSEVDGVPVISIGTQAFYKSRFNSIVIPDGVRNIGREAFCVCESLTSINIPDSITSIGENAFGSCKSLTSISIPKNVTSIDDSGFHTCKALESIEVSPENLSICSVDGVVFNKDLSKLIVCPCGYIGQYQIPDSVTSIGDKGFCYCQSLTSVNIPDSVTSIGKDVFYSCTSLRSVTIPSSITSIDTSAFDFCESLRSIEVSPENLSICSVDGVVYNKDLTELVLCPSGHWSCDHIPEGVKAIGKNAFSGCRSLISVTIPDSVTSIGDSAFCYCGSLKKLTIPDSVNYIGAEAFHACESLKSVTIPNGVKSISHDLFSDCKSLTSVTIPDSVTDIGYGAFENCWSLKSVRIPDSVTRISSRLFWGCKSFTSITIPDNITSISDYGFYFCTSLKSVIIPDSVTNIGRDAFDRCEKLAFVYSNNTSKQWNNARVFSFERGINVRNQNLIKDYLMYNISSDESYLKDADINGDSKINVFDSIRSKQGLFTAEADEQLNNK